MNVKISRVLASLVLLALLKLAVFGMLSVDSVTLRIMQALMPETVPTMALAVAQAQEQAPAPESAATTTPIADTADSAANQAATQETEADKAAAEVRTEQSLPSEWRVLKS
ncbi:MAG: magnesium transporter MgtE, partial [Proteobacteria bacterium]|nr:magnesium transporter MgtE [Pseudomonadota bacterium]